MLINKRCNKHPRLLLFSEVIFVWGETFCRITKLNDRKKYIKDFINDHWKHWIWRINHFPKINLITQTQSSARNLNVRIHYNLVCQFHEFILYLLYLYLYIPSIITRRFSIQTNWIYPLTTYNFEIIVFFHRGGLHEIANFRSKIRAATKQRKIRTLFTFHQEYTQRGSMSLLAERAALSLSSYFCFDICGVNDAPRIHTWRVIGKARGKRRGGARGKCVSWIVTGIDPRSLAPSLVRLWIVVTEAIRRLLFTRVSSWKINFDFTATDVPVWIDF